MLKYYEFQNSAKLLAGKFALENVPGELENLGCSHPLLLSDHVLAKIGTLAIVQDALLAGQVPADTIFTDIPADSSSDVVNEIARFYRKNFTVRASATDWWPLAAVLSSTPPRECACCSPRMYRTLWS